MARLRQELDAYVAGRYKGGLDKAKTSEADYCAFVKRERWLRPYDDDPPPPPAPPAPPPVPLSPKDMAQVTGTWAQHYESADKQVPTEVY